MSTVGFIGLGAMGSRIAGRLLDAGHDVYGTNRTKNKAERLIERGLQWRDTPREVAAAADVVFSMVTDNDALDAISLGPDGILAGLVEGKVSRTWGPMAKGCCSSSRSTSASQCRRSPSARDCCSPNAAASTLS